MQVTPSLPVKSVPEFIAYAKANPGKIAMGSGGNGSPAHVIGEYFKLMTGTDLTHVPYRGAAPAVTDLLGGQIQVAFTELATSLGHVKSGNLRALAVTTAARTEALPDVPTLERVHSGFRGEPVGRARCAQGHAASDHRETQQRDQRRRLPIPR